MNTKVDRVTLLAGATGITTAAVAAVAELLWPAAGTLITVELLGFAGCLFTWLVFTGGNQGTGHDIWLWVAFLIGCLLAVEEVVYRVHLVS